MSPKNAPKPRSHPKGWVWKHNAWYFRVPAFERDHWDGKVWFRLGATDAEAYRVWLERTRDDLDTASPSRSLIDLFDRYEKHILPLKAPNTQRSQFASMKRIRPVFGAMQPSDIRPRDVYQYVGIVRAKHGLVTARHDVALLRHVLTKAVEWGDIDTNPLMGQLRINSVPPRDRYIEDWEIDTILSLPMPRHPRAARGLQIIKLYIQFKLMTGLRRGDILTLRLSNLTTDGIVVQPHKTRKSTGRRHLYAWGEDWLLMQLVNEILDIPPRRASDDLLFCTENGGSYCQDNGQCTSFDSLWQRFMKRLTEHTPVPAFQERDLRAKVATDSDSLESASQRLGHADTAITQRVYRRKPVVIEPLRRRETGDNTSSQAVSKRPLVSSKNKHLKP